MNNRQKSSMVIKADVIILVSLALDQLLKYLSEIFLKDKDDIVVIKDVLYLHYLEGGNTGAAFGIFSGNIIFLVIFTCIASFIILLLMRNIYDLRVLKDRTSLKVLYYFFVFLLSGALGNLIDRIARGYVIDYIYFKIINFPVFNLADCYVTVSCAAILIIIIFGLGGKDFNRIFSFKRHKN